VSLVGQISPHIIISVLVLILGLSIFIYFFEFQITKCENLECYHENLLDCKKSYVINEDDNYVYRYEILGSEGISYCNVDVRLLKVKDGGIDAEDLEGLNMICKANRFENIFPQDDILACSGKLREELQEIIIDRMHNQILQNMQQIKEAF